MLQMELTKEFLDILAIEVEAVGAKTPICPFIMGEPGIGKSSVVKAMCEENGWHFFELLCNQLGDRTDLTGCRSVKEVQTVNGKEEEIWKQIFFPHQAIQDAITCAQNNPNDIVVLFLDEINRTGSDITSAILSFTTARKIGTYTFPDNIRFIVAGNDKGNIIALDSASISRFAKYKLAPSADTYMSIEDNLNPYIRKVLSANPSFIFGKSTSVVASATSGKGKGSDDDGDDDDAYSAEYETFDDAAEGFNQITTPRTISGLNAFLNACTEDKLRAMLSATCTDSEGGQPCSVLEAVIQGHVGDTLFANALCVEINNDIQKGVYQKANTVVKPNKPACYTGLMRCKDRQTRDTMIAGLSDEEKGAVILYACSEMDKDNSDIIQSVAKQFTGDALIGTQFMQLMAMVTNDAINQDNYAALLGAPCALSETLNHFVGG